MGEFTSLKVILWIFVLAIQTASTSRAAVKSTNVSSWRFFEFFSIHLFVYLSVFCRHANVKFSSLCVCIEWWGQAGPSHHHVHALLPRRQCVRRGRRRGVRHGQQRWKRQQLRLPDPDTQSQVKVSRGEIWKNIRGRMPIVCVLKVNNHCTWVPLICFHFGDFGVKNKFKKNLKCDFLS